VFQLSLFGEAKTLVSIDPDRNRFRFYHVSLSKQGNLNYVLERRWGRLKNTLTRAVDIEDYRDKKTTSFLSPTLARKRFLSLLSSKYRKGYR